MILTTAADRLHDICSLEMWETNRNFYHGGHLDLSLQKKPDGIRWVSRLHFFFYDLYIQ